MIKEIQTKSILVKTRNPSGWFGVQYIMNIYKGCQHGCIYCDSRSECYRIENFEDILVKTNSVELLKRELANKRIKGTIGTGAMSDPYTPIENKYKLTREALGVIADFRYPLHITTKSNLILRDRQRDFYYSKLEGLFPGIKEKYYKSYKNYYNCRIKNFKRIKNIFYEKCNEYGISTKMPSYYEKISSVQMSFLDNINS